MKEKQYCGFSDFCGDKACREVSKINHPVDAKKHYNIRRKKLIHSIKLNLQNCPLNILIFIKRLHYAYYFCDLLSKIEQFLNLFVNKIFGGSLKMPTKYCVTKSKKKTPHFSKICPRGLSFHTIHLHKEIHLVY